MRLSNYEIHSIKQSFKEVFKDGKIYLFGSRVDDTQKGGDIDLYIQTDIKDNALEKKNKFLAILKEKIGEQKIDVVISKNKTRAIEQEAINTGVELNLDKIKLQKYFNECDKHLQRIEEAYGDIDSILPLSVEKYKELSKDEVQDIDQYLYRFSKLQDTLGQKIFKAIVNIYEPTTEAIPFLDMLNLLEKLSFLESHKEWLNLRDKRNKIAHQYDDEPYEMTEAINDILNQKDILKSIYLRIKEKMQNYLKKNA
ncbi:MAG: nucleotidyltransferase domain-containing protein [Campylobacterota bacterium]|nr:nucleotidyltransferase domain-containing protein [Campylobacterota bacterium]